MMPLGSCMGNHWTYHSFTHQKGVHQYRYFLSNMRTPNPIVPPHAYTYSMHFTGFLVQAYVGQVTCMCTPFNLVYAYRSHDLYLYT